MTDQELESVKAAVEKAENDPAYRGPFNDWYSMANFPTVESYCRTGWVFYRLAVEAANRNIEKLNAERDQAAGETASGV